MTNDDMDRARVLTFWQNELDRGMQMQDEGQRALDAGVEIAATAGRALRELGVSA